MLVDDFGTHFTNKTDALHNEEMMRHQTPLKSWGQPFLNICLDVRIIWINVNLILQISPVRRTSSTKVNFLVLCLSHLLYVGKNMLIWESLPWLCSIHICVNKFKTYHHSWHLTLKIWPLDNLFNESLTNS